MSFLWNWVYGSAKESHGHEFVTDAKQSMKPSDLMSFENNSDAPFVLVVATQESERDVMIAHHLWETVVSSRTDGNVQLNVCSYKTKQDWWDDRLIGQKSHCQWSLNLSRGTVQAWCDFTKPSAIAIHTPPHHSRDTTHLSVLETVSSRVLKQFDQLWNKIPRQKRQAPVFWGVDPGHIPKSLHDTATAFVVSLKGDDDCAIDYLIRKLPDAERSAILKYVHTLKTEQGVEWVIVTRSGEETLKFQPLNLSGPRFVL